MDVITHGKLTGPVSNSEIIQAILRSRGLKTKSDQANFLTPPRVDLNYLYRYSGITKSSLTKAKKIINHHLNLGHDICIFGDYDADGVTATAVLYLGLVDYARTLGSASRLLPFIPNRHKHGYGLSSRAVSEVISGAAFSGSQYPDFSPKLIITVDTGIVAHAGISSIISSGIDVIITDHHIKEATLPSAQAVVHTTTTSGAGVAWILVSHLLGHTDSLLDLSTIGIVGDMMPLIGFNRSLVATGLERLRESQNLGLRALKRVMGISDRPLTTYDLSFGIAPRINAAGRLHDPLEALRLLCTSSNTLAATLSKTIETYNLDRTQLTEEALTHALKHYHPHKVIALAGPYHEGVIGLVAGKLVEQTHRPALIMSENGEIIKGSARSVPGFNITTFLRSLNVPFLGLGGHDQAAGFSLAHTALPTLLREVEIQGEKMLSDDLLIRHESADLELPLSSVSLSLAKELLTLEPYGLGNPKPRFLFRNLAVVEDRPLGDGGKHHKLTLISNNQRIPLLMFNTKYTHPLNHLVQCIATIEVNVWNNQESVQLIASYVET